MPGLPNLSRLVATAVAAGLLVCCRDSGPAPSGPSRPPPPPPPVSFNFEVRPILSAKCLPCHGPDPRRNRSGLRLDLARPAGAPPLNPERPALLAGGRAGSLLWAHLTSASPADGCRFSLTPSERCLLGRWLDEGAPTAPHWAFRPVPASVPLPKVSLSSWPATGVDHFVLARLDREGMAPAPEAAPLEWLRRASLDLTGLPPAPGEIARFTQSAKRNPSSAMAGAVDRLLASTAFGEHMAARWLRLIGYTDSLGPAPGQPSSQHPYRDWVVRAFNENLPYDRFLATQLAGDLMNRPTRDQILATAFLRVTPRESPDDPAALLEARRTRRLEMFGASALGLSLSCARCHDHPRDPIPQSDHASLRAFFSNTPESGHPGDERIVPAPAILVPSPEQAGELQEARRRIARLEQQLAARRLEAEAASQARFAEPNNLPVIEDLAALFTFDSRSASVPNRALAGNRPGNAAGLTFVPGRRQAGIRCDGAAVFEVPGLLGADRSSPWSISFWFRPEPEPAPSGLMVELAAGAGPRRHGLELLLDPAGRLEARLYREWPGNALAVRSPAKSVTPGRWSFLTCTYDGSSKPGGLRLYLDGAPAAAATVADNLRKTTAPAAEDPPPLRFGSLAGRDGPSAAVMDDIHIHTRALTPLEAAHLFDGRTLFEAAHDPGSPRLPGLRDYYFSALDPEGRRLTAALAAARAAFVALESDLTETAVMRDSPSAVPGSFRSGPPAPAPFSMILPPFPDDAPRDRLGLGRWLTGPARPLVARVAVDRLWANFFDAGLTGNLSGFGPHGSIPSHPGLLDWLTRSFLDHDWDLKHLCRTLVLSATYRQESALRPPSSARDPHNRLLARGPSSLLSASQRRDLLLTVSGLLEPFSGNPAVSSEAPRHRSLYCSWRHRPPPSPEGASACPVTGATPFPPPGAPALPDESPLLGEAAEALAASALRQPSQTVPDRLHSIFLRVASRPPSPQEQTAYATLVTRLRTRITAPEPQNTSPASPELSLWTEVSRLVLLSDAALWK